MKQKISKKVITAFIYEHVKLSEDHGIKHEFSSEAMQMILAEHFAGCYALLTYLGESELSELFLQAGQKIAPDDAVILVTSEQGDS